MYVYSSLDPNCDNCEADMRSSTNTQATCEAATYMGNPLYWHIRNCYTASDFISNDCEVIQPRAEAAGYSCCTDAPTAPPTPPPTAPATPPPTALPTAPPADDGGDDPCFPSSAIVTKADGTPSRIDALKEGDELVAATADGALTTDTVSLLSIAKPEAEAKTLLTLSTAANKTLTLTPEHHVPVGAECCSTLKQAKDVKVDDKVWAVVAGKAVATTVTATSKAHAKGLHSPVLTHGGFPVVDGLVTSFDSIEKVRLATFGLAPLLAACKATKSCDKFKELFLAGDRKYVEARPGGVLIPE